MNRLPKSSGTSIAFALSICVTGLATPAIQAQQLGRRALMIPRTMNGKNVEAEVVNHVVFVFGELASDDAPDGDEWPVEKRKDRKSVAVLYSGSLDELAYGSSEFDVQTRLENGLQRSLQKLNRISELSEAQRQKLELAGRGDVKRLMDRAAKLRVNCKAYLEISDANRFREWAEELRVEAKSLREALDAGPFDASDSLFRKCMKASLSAEQFAKYAQFESTPPYQPPRRRAAALEGALVVP